jgi:hypothetical protein
MLGASVEMTRKLVNSYTFLLFSFHRSDPFLPLLSRIRSERIHSSRNWLEHFTYNLFSPSPSDTAPSFIAIVSPDREKIYAKSACSLLPFLQTPRRPLRAAGETTFLAPLAGLSSQPTSIFSTERRTWRSEQLKMLRFFSPIKIYFTPDALKSNIDRKTLFFRSFLPFFFFFGSWGFSLRARH